MRTRTWRWLVLVFLVLGALTPRPAAAQAPGAQAFDQGVRAFQAGNYAAALQAFLDARRAGLDTPGLRYNLGSTYYRLQRYPEAEKEFEALAQDAPWAALAHYNLALTAQRRGRDGEAVEHFERAYRLAEDPKLRTLAATALARLGRAPEPPRTSVLLTLGGGLDSNATLSPEPETVGVSDQSDLFIEALAVGTHRLTGTPAAGLYGYGALQLRNYLDLDRYDQMGLRAGLSYDTDAARWRTGIGGHLDLLYVDGEALQRAATLDLRAHRRFAERGGFGARYQASRIDGGTDFQYLDGWQQRLLLEAQFGEPAAGARIGYELELNDRRDLQQGADFYSYSPTRHSLLAALALPRTGAWQAEARAEYRRSRYNDPHRLDGGTREITREDDRYGVGARLSRRLAAPWRVVVDYSYYRNDSNLDGYDYDRHQLLLGIEASL